MSRGQGKEHTMTYAPHDAAPPDGSPSTGDRATGRLAVAGMAGALLASSCCIAPLVLVTLGVSGAWIGALSAMAPYQPLFAVGALTAIMIGFWRVRRAPSVVCADGYCARPQARRITLIALWAATALVLAALTVGFWAPWLY
jgi:mercuric ion transport protein